MVTFDVCLDFKACGQNNGNFILKKNSIGFDTSHVLSLVDVIPLVCFFSISNKKVIAFHSCFSIKIEFYNVTIESCLLI